MGDKGDALAIAIFSVALGTISVAFLAITGTGEDSRQALIELPGELRWMLWAISFVFVASAALMIDYAVDKIQDPTDERILGSTISKNRWWEIECRMVRDRLMLFNGGYLLLSIGIAAIGAFGLLVMLPSFGGGLIAGFIGLSILAQLMTKEAGWPGNNWP